MKTYRFILLITFLLIGACSSGDNQTTPQQSSKDHVLEEQMRAIEKAKEVEQMLQISADKRRQTINEQSR